MEVVPPQKRPKPSVRDLLTRIAEAAERIDRKLSQAEDVEFLSIKQAAVVAGLSSTKIRREIKAGRLLASDIGTAAHPHYRIARADLHTWMEAHRGGAPTPPQPRQFKRKARSRYFDM